MALWTPADISTELWLDPSDASTVTESGGVITQLNDKSGNDRHATQVATKPTPAIGSNTINSLNVLTFTGTEILKTASQPIAGTSASMTFMVMRHTDTTEQALTCSGYTDVSAYAYFAAFSFSGRWVFDALFNQRYMNLNDAGASANVNYLMGYGYPANASQTDAAGWETGSALAAWNGTATTMNLAASTTTIGGRYSEGADAVYNGLKGYIGEVIVCASFDSELRQLVEGYLADKWGLTGRLPTTHPFKTAPPATGAISGTIIGADGQPASRTVRLYRRDTGGLVDSTTSDSTTGEYSFVTSPSLGSVPLQCVALADESITYNDLLHRVIPG